MASNQPQLADITGHTAHVNSVAWNRSGEVRLEPED